MSTVRSAKGEKVDFDLLRIKSTMAAVPITDNVKKRERFINKKRRRGLKKKVDEIAVTKRLEHANFEAAVVTDAQKVAEAQHSPKIEESVQPVRRRKIGK